MTAKKGRGIRQTMSDLHIWTGLLVGWILYAMFLTGTVSYFREEITQYMRPEMGEVRPMPPAAEVAERIAQTVLAQTPDTPQIGITLPTQRDPMASAFWRNPHAEGNRRFEFEVFDPHTGKEPAARDTEGGDFFYGFHFNLHYMPALWGRWIAGFCAMFMLVAIISGVITHKKIFTDFFTFRWGKGQRSWLDAHAALSVLGLPFHFMITYSGLITLMFLYMPWGLQALKTPDQRLEVTSETRVILPDEQPSPRLVPLASLSGMVRQAEQRWGEGSVGGVRIHHAGHANARVAVVLQASRRVSTTPHYLVFDGASGALLKDQSSAGPAATVQGVLYGLHMGRFADIVMRWLYFLVSLAGTAMVGSGLVLWTVKRRAKLPDPDRPHFGFRLVERLNIASIAGLSVAMTAYFWGNRLLPVDMAQRSEWEIHTFFIVWGLSLAYAILRPARRAWIELFWLAAGLMALLPVLNALTTDRPIWHSIAHGDWAYAGLELSMLAFAALHAMLAIRTARHKPRKRPQARRMPQPGAAARAGGAA
ncbi:PepSY-associated TM helix domain-containing protein [Allopusillimonas soli]|nr:PepSY-associated TM helix domain-containing protein [Allopusillimonas soli]